MHFEKSLNKVLDHEGGYVNHASDPGGETYRGIARKHWPHWPGWKIIDKIKADRKTPIKRGTILPDKKLNDLVAVFYRANKWEKIYGDRIEDEPFATLLFDSHVHHGSWPIRWLQSYLNEQGAIPILKVDGVLGNITMTAMEGYQNYGSLYNFLLERRRSFLSNWLARNPDFPGVMDRVDSFKPRKLKKK